MLIKGVNRSLHTPSNGTEESENPTEANDYEHTFAIQYTPDKRDEAQGTKETPESSNTASSVENPDQKEKKEKEDTTQEADDASTSEQPETGHTPPKPKPVKKFRSSDPITWYGILVPLSLRSAQKSFTEAVDDHLSELASVIVEMGAVEKEVYGLRNRLNPDSS